MIDLRSDTVTRPSKAMLAAMMAAETGDDVFGEDPTVNRLEALAASMFGMEAAIFCPSGTMTNQVAMRIHLRPGDEVICEQHSHVYLYEGGGIARNAGASVQLVSGDRGRLKAAQIEEAIRPDDVHFPASRLVSLENTANKGGGSCYDLADIREIRELCDRKGLALHLDGARLFNALISKGDRPEDFGALFHTISICLSKGLGAPVGSLLLGSRDAIREARRVRKSYGGGMRQAGILAAAGIFALEHNVSRLAEDHRRAARLAAVLSELPYVSTIRPVETNIMVFGLRTEVDPAGYLQWLESNGVRAVSFGGQLIRFVTHLDLSDGDIDAVATILPGFS